MNKKGSGTVKQEADIIYLVPHSHYDAIWVFTKEDYFHINIELILKKVVALLEASSEFRFLIEQTYLLEEIERRYPELFKKIGRYVREGRIEIGGGEYLMADTMIPQEETLVRDMVTGRRYIKDRFGVDVPVMWQADSFGLNAQLPQIYKKAGYQYIAFRRGSPETKPSEFIWRGLDGTEMLTHFMPLGYRAGLDLSKLEESYRTLKGNAATRHILMPSGSGVTMPQAESISIVKEWNEKHSARLIISSPSQFFKALSQEKADLPIREGEMYSGRFSQVFPDVASSRIWLKRALRVYETKMLVLERLATIADHPSAGEFSDAISDSWKKLLFLSFHDVAPGTGMDEGYAEARQNIEYLKSLLSSLMPRVLNTILESDPGHDDYGDIAVFNPLSWDVSNWVEVDLEFEEGQIHRIDGLKSGSREIDIEFLRYSRYEDESLRSASIGFVADVPAMGYRIYKAMGRKAKSSPRAAITLQGNQIENGFFKLSYSAETGLIEVFQNGRKVCLANELVLEDEFGDLYYHHQILKKPLKTEGGEGLKYGSFKVDDFGFDKPLDGTSLRRVINIDTAYYSLRWPYRLVEKNKPLIWKHNFISFKKKVIIYRDIPRIDFITVVDNKHPRLRLRVRFKTDIKSPEYTCDTQFGAVSRQTNQYYFKPDGWLEQPSGIFPSLRWIDYSDDDKGITILNRGNPENEVRDGNVYITLFRGVGMLSADGSAGPAIPVPEAREMGEHHFRYSIYPHQGGWEEAKSYKQGHEFNYDLSAIQLTRQRKYSHSRSFLKLEPDSLVMTALKRAYDDDGIIVRLYEASGRQAQAVLTLSNTPRKVTAVNLMEERDAGISKKIELDGNKIRFPVGPFEIVTLKIKLQA
jgi:alpha-mannosidase